MYKLTYDQRGAEVLLTSIFYNIKIDPDYTVHIDIPFYEFKNFICGIYENKECIAMFFGDDLQYIIKEINEIIGQRKGNR